MTSGLTFSVALAMFTNIPVQMAAFKAPSAPAPTAVTAETSAPATEVPAEQTAAVAEPVVLGIAEEEVHQTAENNDAGTYPLALDLKVSNGDTLITLLNDAGVSSDESYNVLQAVKKVYDPKKLTVGQKISVHLDKKPELSNDPIITTLILPMSLTSSIEIIRKDDNSFEAKKKETPVERKISRAGGTIDSSLYETGVANGIPASLLADIITAYSYDVDFQRDIKQGDRIDMIYERLEIADGTQVGSGDVLFAELGLGSRALKIYRFVDSTGNSDYYNEKGESVRKALLRTPINGARITSRYGMRNHPILGYSKMHRGVDFGAPTGTPVYAAGDGTVGYVGKKGGYGNYLMIRHNGTYSSAYAHLSKFASGVKSGSKVKQGQIVAYVGSTGQSTGPHLHYEILANGTQVNPSSVKFKTGTVLKGKELAAFQKNMEKIEAMRSTTPRIADLAMLSKDMHVSAE